MDFESDYRFVCIRFVVMARLDRRVAGLECSGALVGVAGAQNCLFGERRRDQLHPDRQLFES